MPKATRPHAEGICIVGECIEGSELIAKYQYKGGEEGQSKFMWYRSSRNTETLIPDSEGKRVYFPVSKDIGCVLKFKLTPIRDDGEVGQVHEAVSQTIVAGKPSKEGSKCQRTTDCLKCKN